SKEHEARAPDDRSSQVERCEPHVRHVGHPGKAGHHDPKRRSETADHDGATPLPVQVVACRVEVLLDPVPDERDERTHVAEDLAPPSAADEETSGVSDEGSEDGRRDRRTKWYASLEGKNTAEDHRDLAGKDEPDERGRLERGNEEDDRERDPAVQAEDPVANASDHGATIPEQAGLDSGGNAVRQRRAGLYFSNACSTPPPPAGASTTPSGPSRSTNAGPSSWSPERGRAR